MVGINTDVSESAAIIKNTIFEDTVEVFKQTEKKFRTMKVGHQHLNNMLAIVKRRTKNDKSELGSLLWSKAAPQAQESGKL